MNSKIKVPVSKVIKKIILDKGLTIPEVVAIIDKRSDEKLKRICTITNERLTDIVEGSKPSFIECILIADALDIDSATYFLVF